ncbi:MAG: response regulator [Polyangiaceae bacterium]
MSHQPHAQATALNSAPRRRGTKRVCLIVESDPDLRKSLEALIRELDVAALGVEDALDALAVLDTCPVDLIMTEEFLPGHSGTSLLRVVRQRWPLVARVLVSDALAPDVLVRAVNECGVHRVLSKRMHPVALRDEVEAALNENWLAAPDCHSGRLTIPPFSRGERARAVPEPGQQPPVRLRLHAVGE